MEPAPELFTELIAHGTLSGSREIFSNVRVETAGEFC